jgi:hypothetical protein
VLLLVDMGLLSVALLVSGFSLAAGQTKEFTVRSQPVELRYGEVHNKMQYDAALGGLALPDNVIAEYASGDKLMAITGFRPEIVRMSPSGEETLVKLSDHYLHHYILQFGQAQSMRHMLKLTHESKHVQQMVTGCHGMKGQGARALREASQGSSDFDGLKYASFGSAAGAEYRHNPQQFPAPYRLVLSKPEVWVFTLHMINTNLADNHTKQLVGASGAAEPQVSRLLECPCTPQRNINVTAGTIDGHNPDPPIKCSRQFEATGNPSCHLSTYVGGWRCCEHGMFLIDTEKECFSPTCEEKVVDKVYMKFTFYYEDAVSTTRQIEAAACCDVTSSGQGDENIEYDVPLCSHGTAPEACMHVAESVQPLGHFSKFPWQQGPSGSDLVDLVVAAPHLHWAGISLTLIDDETNKTLCEVHRSPDNSAGVMYGNGTTPGNENGYLVGLQPCWWSGDKALRFRRDHKMRTRAVYDASSYHFGVMSLWLMQVSAAPKAMLV